MKHKKKDKKIYIVLTYTGTILSKVIKYYTKAEYCHVSIAFNKSLNKMYSFGRLNPYNPFIGGFVEEGIDIGTFKRFKNTEAAIYSFDLTYKQYRKLRKIIRKVKKERDLYRFNIIGLFASGFNIKVKRKNYFYCSEFIRYLFEECKLKLELPEIIKPNDFKNLDKLKMLYRGILRDYKVYNNS